MRRYLVVPTVVAMLGVGADVNAGTTPHTHVRSGDPIAEWLLDAGATYSSTFRHALDDLEQSDVVAYIVINATMRRATGGKIAFVGTTAGTRYVLITVIPDTPTRALVMLGHELTHAVEISRDATIVDAASMANAYLHDGVVTGVRGGKPTVDTAEAVMAGRNVERELRGRSSFLRTALAQVEQRMESKGPSRQAFR